jgi:hypothetical protein
MVNLWLPADTHRRLLEGLPGWSRTHQLLTEAIEVHHAVGVRRVRCDGADAFALLQVAERVYPEAAPLIRIAIRKAGSPAHGDQAPAPSATADSDEPARELYPEPEPPSLRRLASVHVLVLSFQLLQFLDRVRELVRRVV